MQNLKNRGEMMAAESAILYDFDFSLATLRQL